MPIECTNVVHRKHGAAYVITLLVIVVLTSITMIFSRSMWVEARGSTHCVSSTQAKWIALGALEAIRGELAEDLMAGRPLALDTLGVEAVPLGGGKFWVIGQNYDGQTNTFGLVSETGKLNLNVASYNSLAMLPHATDGLAAAIVDWRDPDDELTELGAESSYYASLIESYRAKNEWFETVGELQYVRGVKDEILRGEDVNQNGMLDANEDDGASHTPSDNANGRLDFGLLNYLTVHSTDPNEYAPGIERLNVNQGGSGDQALEALLRSELTKTRADQVIAQIQSNRPFVNTLDFFVKTGLNTTEFDRIHDRLRTSNEAVAIDVYNSSAAVLNACPGLGPGDGELIVASRPRLTAGDPIPSLAWLINVVGEAKAIEAASHLTTRSFQFTADIVALSGDGRAFCRLSALLDAAPKEDMNVNEKTLPRLISMRDNTALGWPLEQEILEAARRGIEVSRLTLRSRGE